MVVIYGRALLSEADPGPRTQAEAIHESALLGAGALLPLYLPCFAGRLRVNPPSSGKNISILGLSFPICRKDR